MPTFSFQPNSLYFKIRSPACPISSSFLFSAYVIKLVLVLNMHVIFPLGAKQQSIIQRKSFSEDINTLLKRVVSVGLVYTI